jgi:lipopolysaccharide transport system ATP-binding protein
MKPILEVRNLWKQYKIGGQQASYLSLREKLLQPFQRQKMDTFWALQDINFDIFEGECVGIIGRNGAGKSTLLKILSQITPPTKGYIKARGRVASLLEVGTGFHPELTGRENIYLNGSILGLKRSEINAKFDEIIDFSGIEKFLNTPLKHYSSGMKLRLAFSVAAHLEPEILLIDEVLAVGDAEFQKKCLGKMDEVSKSGRTVLFVSHNLGAIAQLCKKSILLNKGNIEKIGFTPDIITTYLSLKKANNISTFNFSKKNNGTYIKQFLIISQSFSNTNTFSFGEPLKFNFKIQSNLKQPVCPVIGINDEHNQRITTISSDELNIVFYTMPDSSISISLKTTNLILSPGTYNLKLALRDNVKNILDVKEDLVTININETPYSNIKYNGNWGTVKILSKWEMN